MAADSVSLGDPFVLGVAHAFRRAGWKVRLHPPVGREHADLIVSRGAHAYVAKVRSASEGRRDRLLPLLAQAILQARAFARGHLQPAAALAIVGASRVSPALVRDLEKFAHDYAPDDAVGVVDLEGFRWFRGPGLDAMNAEGGKAERRLRARAPDAAALHLFSDLNQWMLKVLLAPGIAPDLLSAPRGEYRNASQLSAAAGVSVMSAFRFVRQLRREGFIDEASPILRLVRLDELLRRWQVDHLGPAREVPMQWILRGDPERQLHDALRDAVLPPPAASSGSRQPRVPLRACLGLFAAADALGLGFVRGVAPHVFFDRLDAAAIERLGLSLEAPRSAPDVVVRLAPAPESVFRGVVWRDGVPVSDALQVWLDAGAHPSRGAEQADLIYRRVLKPLVEGRRP